MELHVYFILPVSFCIRKSLLYFAGGIIFLKQVKNLFFIVFHANQKNIICFFPRSKRDGFKAEGAHRFLSGRMAGRCNPRVFFIYGAGMRKASPFADEIFDSGIETLWCIAITRTPHNIINMFIGTVPFFIKGHGGADKDSVFIRINPVQHGCDIPVVADVVCTAPIDRNRGIRS